MMAPCSLPASSTVPEAHSGHLASIRQKIPTTRSAVLMPTLGVVVAKVGLAVD